MTPPARGYVRLCSSVLAPLVLLAVLWQQTAQPNSAHLQAARRPAGVVPAIPVEVPDGVHLVIAKPQPKPKPIPAPKPAARVVWPAIPQEALSVLNTKRSVFSGLGAWIDVYDYPVLPLAKTIATMKAAGVETLYIETGLSSTKQAVVPESLPWLVAAHNAGMKVVAWYLPYYVNVPLDVARTAWIARLNYHGIRFDGIGVDIEYKGAMANNRIWNRNVVRHMNGVRRALGPNYPLAAIPPPPLQMRLAPETWRGFPWAQLGKSSSEIMLMSYWSFRTGCPKVTINCAYDFTRWNVLITRKLTGGRVPIHVIGGVGDNINHRQLNQFVQGAIDAHADGASIYDVGTTKPSWWQSLTKLRALGS
jgi:hypothetical protein